ncbi:MAG: tetratricopeptide repeat protein [Flavobacterium sp.]|nr:tetratricopeptide repeat protein [Flavobacterium sp.]
MLKKLSYILSFIILTSCDFTSAESYYNQAIELSQQKKYENAILLFDKAIEKKDNFRPALINRAYCKAEIGDYKEAIKDYEKVIQFDSDNTFALCEIGYNWSNLKNHQKAIDFYNKALNTEGALHTSLNSERQKIAINTNLEVKLFDNNADYNVLDCEIYYNRGIEYFKLKEYEKAINDFKKSLETDNMISNSHYYIGKSYLELNDTIKSCENFIISANLGDIEAKEMLNKHCNRK